MKRDDHQGNPDPEAALAGSSSQLEPHLTQTVHAGGEQSDSETSRQGTSLRRVKSYSDFIPLTHPPPIDGTLSNNSHGNSNDSPPRLMHSFLHKIPMQIRYAVYGTLSSALFMLLYNVAVDKFCPRQFTPPTIYAASYLFFIPIQHAMAACLVFGWPDRYFPSLWSNVPIGLTAIALGSYLTAYLDQIKFNESMENVVQIMGLWNVAAPTNGSKEENKNEFYTSFFVLIVTSFWSFLLSVFVNAPAETLDKKEL